MSPTNKMSEVEKLHFKIGIGGTYWDNKPQYTILINDIAIKTQEVSTPSGELEYVEFDQELAEGACVLKIRLENKTINDTIQNEDKTAIVKDMLLDIRSVEIDDIDIGNLVYTHSEFVGDDSTRPVLKNCVNLGWNGTWCLPFNSPFYVWLLENI
jgi:hypothetical protein